MTSVDEGRATEPDEIIEVDGPDVAGPLLQWRQKKASELRGLRERRTFSAGDLELREAADGTLTLTGYASVTETPYDVGFYQETIRRGAFRRTLGENPDVQLLINHAGMPLARTLSGTLQLEEDNHGLKVTASLDPEDPDAQSLVRKMRRGDIDQMSFAFQVTDAEWNEEWDERTIRSLSIHRGDVSVVNQGANPATIATVRSAEVAMRLHDFGLAGVTAALVEWRDHTLLPLEVRAGRTLSAATTDVLTQVLSLVASADEAVDEVQPMLAELLGVPNPDADDESTEDDTASEADSTEGRTWVPPDYTTRARQQLDGLSVTRGGR